jgi:hypothetical protein
MNFGTRDFIHVARFSVAAFTAGRHEGDSAERRFMPLLLESARGGCAGTALNFSAHHKHPRYARTFRAGCCHFPFLRDCFAGIGRAGFTLFYCAAFHF